MSVKSYISQTEIEHTINSMATKINAVYQGAYGTPITVLCVLKGAFIFCADLIRQLKMPVKVEFLTISSYEGENSTGKPIIHYLPSNIEDQNVLIVEDIVDTGICIAHVLDVVKRMNPASVRIAALIAKPSRRLKHVFIDFVGFNIEDVFIVGYGLDFNQAYRNLPYIGIYSAGDCNSSESDE